MICEQDKCVGCFACVNACPQTCITMEQNEIGHVYPKIDDKICIHCNKCKLVCPVNTEPSKTSLHKVYATYSLNEEEHRTSSSGGVAACFSRNVIQQGGVVYGASSKVIGDISHIRVDSIEDLPLLRGSKYVHSFIKNCYAQAKADLLSGIKVLFIGTPCQIAGLRSYLGKQYDNLILVDLICHGVPPQKLLFEHLKKVDVNNKLLSFRGINGFFLSLKDEKSGELVYRKNYNYDRYCIGFFKGLYYRNSCYSCRYATPERCSDITIGDFWGLGKNKPFTADTKKGVSVVMLNTEKGLQFWNSTKSDFFYEQRDFEEAVNGNPNLRKASAAHRNKRRFELIYPQKGFEKAVKETLIKEIVKGRILGIIQGNRMLSKVLRFMYK